VNTPTNAKTAIKMISITVAVVFVISSLLD